MASNFSLFLSLITSCLLVTGCLCLECQVCNELDVGCVNPSGKNCTEDENICTSVLFSGEIGNQMERKIVKGCAKGSPKNSISTANSYGIQIKSSWRSCNSAMCNDKVIELRKGFTQKQDSPTSGLQCYSCFSFNELNCSTQSAEKVKCPVGHNTCYGAAGNLTIGNTFVPIFVKQCSVPTNVNTFMIHADWFSISLIAAYCTGDFCNEKLTSPTELPTVPTTQNMTSPTELPTVPTTKNLTSPTELPTVPTTKSLTSPTESPTVPTTDITLNSTLSTKEVQPVTTAITITTSGIGRTHPCYVAIIILVVMESFL